MTQNTINGKTLSRTERDSEFMEIYTRALELALKQRVAHPKRLAVRWTIYNGSPRYHVSYDRAYKVVRHLLSKPTQPLQSSLQLEMWREITSRVKMLTEGRAMSVAQALEFVLMHGRASRFFVSERYAYESIVPRARRERMQRLFAKHVQ